MPLSPKIVDNDSADLILQQGWLPYSELEKNPGPFATAKIIFEIPGDTYVVSEKRPRSKLRRRNPRTNHRYEWPGGRVEPGESGTAALLRELNEEDPSLVLASALARTLKQGGALRYRIAKLKDGSQHLLFRARLAPAEAQRFFAFWDGQHEEKEIYSYHRIEAWALNIKDTDNAELWTPKSIRILKALRKESLLLQATATHGVVNDSAVPMPFGQKAQAE